MAKRAASDPISYGGPGFGLGLARDPAIQASTAMLVPSSYFAISAYQTYHGIKHEDYGEAIQGGIGVAFTAATIGLKYTRTTETYYRTMASEDFAIMQKTGKIPATSETFLSPSAAYSSKYEGVLVEINTKAGTLNQLKKIGVRDPSQPMTSNLKLPSVSDGWTKTNAFFKQEKGQINIGLGQGKALETFNNNILNFKQIPKQ